MAAVVRWLRDRAGGEGQYWADVFLAENPGHERLMLQAVR